MIDDIYRSEERIKQNGEVFTPMPLVYEILDKLPPEVWHKDKTFLDNSCGDGNFLEGVLRRKVEKGIKVLKALSTIYGVDLMPDNVLHARQRLVRIAKELNPKVKEDVCREIVNANIVCHDALTYDYSFSEEPLLT
jgi:SAM-dependent methyltransferase